MKAAALDPSLRATGICLPNGDAGWIDPGKRKGMERVQLIRDQAMGAIKANTPAIVAIEGLSYNSYGRGTTQLAGLGTVLRLALHEARITTVDIPPACRAKYATGRGQASKREVIEAADALGRYFVDDNATDAWWLWQMTLAFYAPESTMVLERPPEHRKALLGVDWPIIRRGNE